jgi:hypothetical protein
VTCGPFRFLTHRLQWFLLGRGIEQYPAPTAERKHIWSCTSVSKQDLSNKIGRWLGNQHQRRWQDLGNSQRQTQKLILEPSRGTWIRFLSFSREQSRVVTGLLTGHNTLRRHLHLMVVIDSLQCRKGGAEDETSVHILCRCEALASIRHAHLGSFFLESEDILRFSKAAGLP